MRCTINILTLAHLPLKPALQPLASLPSRMCIMCSEDCPPSLLPPDYSTTITSSHSMQSSGSAPCTPPPRPPSRHLPSSLTGLAPSCPVLSLPSTWSTWHAPPCRYCRILSLSLSSIPLPLLPHPQPLIHPPAATAASSVSASHSSPCRYGRILSLSLSSILRPLGQYPKASRKSMKGLSSTFLMP